MKRTPHTVRGHIQEKRFFKNRMVGDSPEPVEELVGFSERQLRFLAESLPQIAWTGMPDGYIDYMNGRWFDYTGLTPNETYKQLKTAVHPDDLKHYKESWANAVKTQQPYEVEYRFRRASDGAYRWFLGRGFPVRDMQGKVMKWFGTCTDIHAQKEAGEEIKKINEQLESVVKTRTAHLQEEIEQRRETERRYVEHLRLLQRMINTLPMAAVAVNSKGKILHANELFRDLFIPELTPEEIEGSDCKKLLQSAQEYLPSKEWKRLFARMEKSQAFREEMTVKDGRTFEFEYIQSSEEEQGYLLLARDISDEKKIDAVKSEFMSLASHQLRTPLTSIRWALGRLQTMLNGRLDPKEQVLLEKTRESTVTMAETIKTMLSISRIEAGMQSFNPQPISIKAFLQEMKESFADLYALKSISLQVECDDSVSVNSDLHLLQEIMSNLLSNSSKYTLKNGSVHLRAWKEETVVYIELRDTGVGIPLHQQQKVFTKFFRAENIFHLDTQGSGLGLYLVSKLVEVLNGNITFTSRVGEGTTFLLTFPDANT